MKSMVLIGKADYGITITGIILLFQARLCTSLSETKYQWLNLLL